MDKQAQIIIWYKKFHSFYILKNQSNYKNQLNKMKIKQFKIKLKIYKMIKLVFKMDFIKYRMHLGQQKIL